jgi:uncharacterized membrane protein YtjA (UPF0391 family)
MGASTSGWSSGAVRFYALIFFLIALVAGWAGFNDIAPGIGTVARMICYGALALAIVSLIADIRRR